MVLRNTMGINYNTLANLRGRNRGAYHFSVYFSERW